MIQITVTAALVTQNWQLFQQKSSNSLKLSKSSEQDSNNNNDNESDCQRFWLKNVDFFDSNFKLNSVDITENKQIYYNFFSFTN